MELKKKSGNTGPKRTPEERERDLVLVAGMYVQSFPQHKIAEALNEREGIDYSISREAIRDDIAEIRKRWVANMVSDMNEVKAQQLEKIDAVENEAWAAWQRSLMLVSRSETKAVKVQAVLPPTGYVYVMYNKSNKYHKIGHSKSPQKREKTLQSQEPDIEMLFWFEGSRRDEQNLQKMFAMKQVRGEWFKNLDSDDMQKIQEYIDDIKSVRLEKEQEDNMPDKIEKKVFEATGLGDSAFLNVILKCVGMRMQLFGINKATLQFGGGGADGSDVSGVVLILPSNNRDKNEEYNEDEINKMIEKSKQR